VSKVVVHGGRPLSGRVAVSPAKNAILPMLAASLLAEGEVRLEPIPWLEDVDVMVRLIRHMGVLVRREGSELVLDARAVAVTEAPAHLVRRMRASFLVAGPLLARFGKAVLPLPGGCAIGRRPIDLHLKGLWALGAEVEERADAVCLYARRLRGADIVLDFPSVGATENLLMAATLAKGTTRIRNAAREPEVEDLAHFLMALGAEIEGEGTGEIVVHGVAGLHGGTYSAIPDRIEAATFLVAGAITEGDVTVTGVLPQHLGALLAKLDEAGVEVEVSESSVRCRRTGPIRPVAVTTEPYPGFPTDMQAPMLALLTLAEGTSRVRETIFENRFHHAYELTRLGAQVRVEGQVAVVEGVPRLRGGIVRASDLRGAAALVLAALAADGVSEVQDAHHLDRGYHQFERKLAFLGAQVERVESCVEVG